MNEERDATDARRQSRRRRLILATGGLAVAVCAAVLVAVSTEGASGVGAVRTAVASTATVRQTMSVAGTVAPVDEATADFQVAGEVATVNVSLGQTVAAGQTLATLDAGPLQQGVSAASLSLSADRATLSEDESAQSSSATSTTTTTTTTTPGASGAEGSGQDSLKQDQLAVTSAQKAMDADSQSATAALSAAQGACPGGGSGATTPGSTTTTTAPDDAACAAALNQALGAQDQVAQDQTALAGDEDTLAQLLATPSGDGNGTQGGGTDILGSTKPNVASSTPGSTGMDSGSGSSSSGSSSSGKGDSGGDGADDSAAQLARDQSAIDSDVATLIEAQQSLAAARLTSPIAGTVASVDLAAGQSVSAGASTDAITVINTGSYAVTTSVSSSQSTEVHVGDEARVTVDGIAGVMTGTVSLVGPVDTSAGDTYPVTVALAAGSDGITAGSAAQLQIVLRQADDTVVVPTSAVHRLGSADYAVMVVRSGRVVRQKVTVGVVGAVDTQITSGIGVGTTVVLADLATAVPSSSTNILANGFVGNVRNVTVIGPGPKARP